MSKIKRLYLLMVLIALIVMLYSGGTGIAERILIGIFSFAIGWNIPELLRNNDE